MIEAEKQQIRINRNVKEKKEIIFVEGDMIIPDVKPDILKPIALSGIPTIYKQETTEKRLRIDGNINTYIMYLASGEQNETRGINTTLDFSEMFEINEVTENSKTQINTKVKSIECIVINERKINIKVALEVGIKITEINEIEMINNIGKNEQFQVLKQDMVINNLIGESSTKVTGKEIIQIDSFDNLAEILKVDLQLTDKDVKVSYNKVLTKTDAIIKILYLTEENEIKLVVGKIPIVGFIDIPNVSDNNISEINYRIRNLIIKPNSIEEHSIYVEIETEINCMVYEEKSINLIQDIYSPYKEIEMEKEQMNVVTSKRKIEEKNSIQSKTQLENLNNKNVIDVEVETQIISEKVNGTVIRYESELKINIIILNQETNIVEIKEEKISFDFKSDLQQQDLLASSEIAIGNVNFEVQNNELKTDVDILFKIEAESRQTLQIIKNISEGEDRKPQEYSVIIYIVKSGDTLWNIAKKFGTTVENLQTINGLEDENKLMSGQQIFIPRYN